MKKILFLLILNVSFLIPNSFCHAQIRNQQSAIGNPNIDSLQTLLKTDKADTNKVNHSCKLCREYLNIGLYDTALHFGNTALQLAQQLNFKKGIADAYSSIGIVYYRQGNYPDALKNYFASLKIYEAIGNKKGITASYTNIGNVYFSQGNYPEALKNYFAALKIREAIGDKKGIASSYINIGTVYGSQDNYPDALKNFFASLKIREAIGDKQGIAATYNNIGNVYDSQGNYPDALKNQFASLQLQEALGDKQGIAGSYNNIGNIYYSLGNYPDALKNHFASLKIREAIGDKDGIAASYINIGEVYTKQKKYKEAEEYLMKGKKLSTETGSKESIKASYSGLAEADSAMGNWKAAYQNNKLSIIYKDSIDNEQTRKKTIQSAMQYEYDAKETAVQAEQDKKDAVQQSEAKREKVIRYSVIAGLVLMFIVSLIIFRSLRVTRKQKRIIELQKNEVSKQKEIVEKQKEKIVDSITYAQRIQQSILMEEREVQNYLPECFIYFQPKDIVSGDFYWCSKTNDKIIIAAVDCTGHGVPGAFMSMIGNTLLNQIVNEKHITRPSEILHYLNLGVYEALHQKKDGALSDDGMDISLCCIDYKNNEVEYAGQNPLYVLSDGKIEVIKGDIYGIGGGGMIAKIHDPLKKVFANHVIPIKEGMSIYLFSDGYMDQFGGDNRKKFGAQKFKDLLLNNLHLNMQKQKELIASAHTEWKGSGVQIDDILVIGIRI